MYMLITVDESVYIMRGDTEVFKLRREDLGFALKLYYNLHAPDETEA